MMFQSSKSDYEGVSIFPGSMFTSLLLLSAWMSQAGRGRTSHNNVDSKGLHLDDRAPLEVCAPGGDAEVCDAPQGIL